jgi:beta-N-acetylhexosaminidase
LDISAEMKREAGLRLMVGFRGSRFEEELEGLIRSHFIGGAVLFRRNVENPGQLKRLTGSAQDCALKHLGRPILLAIDQEGGPVQRLASPPFLGLPSARKLADEGPEMIWASGVAAARELKDLGIHLNLAPVLDVLPKDHAGHFMEERCLGSDPQRVAELGRIWITALQSEGVSATAKHFPGLGHASLDPHHYAPVIHWNNGASMERDLAPFREAVSAGVHCVMTSHSLYPAVDSQWPATLSPTLCSEWLRQRLGFDGVLLSDDLDMAAVAQRFSWETIARQGALSSIDFFLLCQNPENVDPFSSVFIDLLNRSSRLRTLHEQSVLRIRQVFLRLGLAGTAW